MIAAMKYQNYPMTLKQLLGEYVNFNYLPDIPVNDLSLDSRTVQPGDVFVALEGAKDHGLVYAHAAVNKGAVAVLCDRRYDQYCQQLLSALITRTVCIPVPNLRERLGEIASRFYDAPSHQLFMVGITGTDGKTSVSNFVAQAMRDKNHSSAVIGTIGNGFIGELNTASHTTPNVIEVHRLLAQMRDQGASQVAMEVSSHGLDQGRVDAVDFDVAVFTNLGRDHMDYHGSIDAYRMAKQRLFHRPEIRAAVLNLDDAFGRQLATDLQSRCEVWGYCLGDAPVNSKVNLLQASRVRPHASGLDMRIHSSLGEADVRLGVMGMFNAANVLATLGVLLARGIGFNNAIARIHKLKTVPGRMETCRVDGKPLAVIDYAHTPQALSSVLTSLRAHCTGKLICVFGCGGDRDRGKRPLMADVSERLADAVIVTDDNPRTENAADIAAEVMTGFKRPELVQVIHNRSAAIQHALDMASADDIVLIAGKGHEDYQIIGNEKRPFSDMVTVRQCLGVCS